jgi:WD40 repeat protein
VRNILAAGYHDGGALVWDAHSGEKLFALKEKEFEQKINGHTIKWRDPSATHIHAISWHPEEKFIVTGGGDDRAINLWHVHKTAQLVYASEPGDHIASVKDSHTEQIWGIDMSIDYVDNEKAFEVFHFEWDDFEYDTVIAKQKEIENLVLNIDWDDAALAIWQRKDDWIDLDFSGQSKYKTDFFGLPAERFKQNAWE